MVLKALHQRINRTVVPDRPNRRATSQAAIAIEDLAHDSQSSSSATSSAGSTIDLLDSDDDREVSSEGDCEVAYCDREVAHGNMSDPTHSRYVHSMPSDRNFLLNFRIP